MLKLPRQVKPLILYLALEENTMGAMLAQEGPKDVEHTIYYLSKKFLPYEEKYNLVEKTCLIMIDIMQIYIVFKGILVLTLFDFSILSMII